MQRGAQAASRAQHGHPMALSLAHWAALSPERKKPEELSWKPTAGSQARKMARWPQVPTTCQMLEPVFAVISPILPHTQFTGKDTGGAWEFRDVNSFNKSKHQSCVYCRLTLHWAPSEGLARRLSHTGAVPRSG